VTALLVATLLFLSSSFALLVAAACTNAMVLQFMWSQRILNSTHGMNDEQARPASPNAASD
jgi:hypothetical protein